jgi:hypothetical protein
MVWDMAHRTDAAMKIASAMNIMRLRPNTSPSCPYTGAATVFDIK